ncbi:MD-2-related lipid recognition domain-containing protein [Arabidopsis thaliana]|uniref:At2g26370 n=1 Tax=Arabidopsis thaliana TaxID=3702 RepID=O48704_ARATH|nr:MD-2-related lipid recognition domain-containing protein [Arabidopsis thaliana]AAC14488.1 hypothetical protein [Arabidopsis thaliana]AAQ65118.1 At2g26370 [Arabidopsis thaliana]AAX55127.1 hypothetical protein At2g26370 [Arabidopsis thaliana]AEC07830.1 MD-2-related lipid recognition domain-containing protein [Arabidopsis thaliana]BAD42941.1 hypothetical protein [Arabidopsis thaliana]|eukprot:NP_180205.1 MD-2-related lipid recognition domain-containing protein [Arabidopsis thaliana]
MAISHAQPVLLLLSSLYFLSAFGAGAYNFENCKNAPIDYNYGITNVTRVEISPYPVGPYDEPTITISGFTSDDSYIIYRATIHVLYKYENVNSTIINYDLSDVMGEDPCSIEPGEKFVLTLSKVPGLQSLPHKDKSKIVISLVDEYGDDAEVPLLKMCVEFDNPAPTTTSVSA